MKIFNGTLRTKLILTTEKKLSELVILSVQSPIRSQESGEEEGGLSRGDFVEDDGGEGHHGDAPVPELRGPGPAPLPLEGDLRHGQELPVAVVRLQQRVHAAHGHQRLGVLGAAREAARAGLAVFAGATRGEGHVGQRLDGRAGEVVDEELVAPEGRHPAPARDPGLLRHLPVLHVDLLQRLNVLADEGDGHHHEAVHPLLGEVADRVVRVGLQPLHGPHPRLVRERVPVVLDPPAVQLVHNQLDGFLHLLLVRVPGFVHVGLGHAVGREEDVGLGGRKT
mmetsp:Transcript_10129/g.20594  ORF Transcript_10129/g.20594 Transcript_10129/m.20594 type:complete len:280 (+) Transcript_10129:1317-2156(+)